MTKWDASNCLSLCGQRGIILPLPGPSHPMKRIPLCCAALVLSLAAGCLNVKTAPIEVKPIHITVDVNVKVERALEDFFGDIDKKSATIETPKPAATP